MISTARSIAAPGIGSCWVKGFVNFMLAAMLPPVRHAALWLRLSIPPLKSWLPCKTARAVPDVQNVPQLCW